MKRLTLFLGLTLMALAIYGGQATVAKWTSNMQDGRPALQSAGPISFGPDGVLFVADTKAAAIFAIATGDTRAAAGGKMIKVDGVNEKIASLLGTTADQILIEDLAVNPISRAAYLAVSRGRGADATPVLIRIRPESQPELVSLDKVKFSKADLPEAPADTPGQGGRPGPRRESITDIAYVDGRVLIAGLSNEEFASTLRAIPYPFKQVTGPTSVEIYHGAHGRFETRAPVRTFVPFKVGKEDHLLAAYTCTPLVQFPLSELRPGAKIKGKTIAELGNRNRPLDMLVYEKDGKTYLLMSNSSRGVMKIATERLDAVEGIVAPVPDGAKKGLAYETIEKWTGVDQLDRFDKDNVIVLRRGERGALNLESLPLP